MPKIQYKRAQQCLNEIGLNYLILCHAWGGCTVQDTRACKQNTQVFSTWQEALQAVLDGYRPTVLKWKKDSMLNGDSTCSVYEGVE